MYTRFFKRIFDIVIAALVLLVFSPIFLIIWALLSIANNGSAFFYQQRPGKHQKVFKIIKFKSMNDKKDKEGNLLPDFKRMTIIGKFIRNTSLDELPQLLNVLKGDMSLVGPRPLLVSYLPLYSEEQNKRHLVKPGITGWAQVNGRNTISWDKKFEYDVWYVNHISFMLDMKIYFMTFLKVVKRSDISASENTTMEKFVGSK
ncbi:sugar transferase [Maribacter litoralis]|uniref:Undecaprenyl phosphate N,N'-diacetylbacillosamine 1-phosphate transferase n=1 Tax=Maribacter litoralis TaxID=2059726 RepID=A0A653VAX2_9FLAO|nr:sugar transferase [Maribacter litoralis]VXC03131.1 Undecaprenyl phosphate N,N'-diacetylbacillosamine 1-phosphate transferase [Maribacter litoralis]